MVLSRPASLRVEVVSCLSTCVPVRSKLPSRLPSAVPSGSRVSYRFAASSAFAVASAAVKRCGAASAAAPAPFGGEKRTGSKLFVRRPLISSSSLSALAACVSKLYFSCSTKVPTFSTSFCSCTAFSSSIAFYY